MFTSDVTRILVVTNSWVRETSRSQVYDVQGMGVIWTGMMPVGCVGEEEEEGLMRGKVKRSIL